MKRDSAMTGGCAQPSVPLFYEHGGSSLCIFCLTNTVFWCPNRYEMQEVYHGQLKKYCEKANIDGAEVPAGGG